MDIRRQPSSKSGFVMPSNPTALKAKNLKSTPSEKWTDKLFKGIGPSRKQDIQVGDDQIDSRFIIQGTDEKEIISLLSDQNIRKNINSLDEKRLKKGANKGSYKIFDNRVTYSEGPYDHEVGYAKFSKIR